VCHCNIGLNIIIVKREFLYKSQTKNQKENLEERRKQLLLVEHKRIEKF